MISEPRYLSGVSADNVWLNAQGLNTLNKWASVEANTCLHNADKIIDPMASPIKTASKSVLKAIEAFRSSAGIGELFVPDALEYVKARLIAIDEMQAEYACESLSDLKTKLQQALKKDQLNQLAVIRETIKHFFGFTPHNTQMLVILILLDQPLIGVKGAIAQVKTGEGKSTLVAMMAAYQSLSGNPVDVVSSAIILAERDARKYHDVYQFLGLRCGYICVQSPAKEDFRFDILYGTNTDFEYALLRDLTQRKKLRKDITQRSTAVCIVDEVDNLIIDKGTSSAILNMPKKDIFEPLVQYIYRLKTSKTAGSLKPKPPAHLQALIDKLPEDVFSHWLLSCEIALTKYQENIHYILEVQDGASTKITIIEESTGELQQGSRWGNRIHQFLELKHGLSVVPEGVTVAEINHINFFNTYGRLYGLTGTLGDEAERYEIRNNYAVQAFDAPSHSATKLQQFPPIVCENQIRHFEGVLNEIYQMTGAHRPVLVLFQSIEKTHQFAHFLGEHEQLFQTLDGLQEIDKTMLIERAGFSGTVTLATNIASRGADIQLDDMSLKQGGLHVILAYFPDSVRVEEQCIGRSARQGQPGSSRLIINLKDLPGEKKENQGIRQLKHEREARTRAAVLQRAEYARQAIKRYEVLQQFSQKLHAWFLKTEKSDFSDAIKHSSVVDYTYQKIMQDWAVGFSALREVPEDKMENEARRLLSELSVNYFDRSDIGRF